MASEDRILVVEGGSIPGIRPGGKLIYPPTIRRIVCRHTDGAPEWMWPRDRPFTIAPSVSYGTIDELTENYKEKMTRAYDSLKESPMYPTYQEWSASNGVDHPSFQAETDSSSKLVVWPGNPELVERQRRRESYKTGLPPDPLSYEEVSLCEDFMQFIFTNKTPTQVAKMFESYAQMKSQQL